MAGRPAVMSQSDVDLFRFIESFWLENKTSPTFREIVQLFGISSTSLASFHVQKLVKVGLLKETSRNKARVLVPITLRIAIEPVDVDREALEERLNDKSEN